MNLVKELIDQKTIAINNLKDIINKETNLEEKKIWYFN